MSDAINKIVAASGVNGVTRQALFDQLDATTSFNAGGMLGKTNIAEREPSACYVLTQVKNGKFVRVTPSKKGTFDCNPKNAITIKADYIDS